MNETKRTSLSAGLIVMDLLQKSPVKEMVTKIFPLVTDKAELPYICYRKAGGEYTQLKKGVRDTVYIEVWCFARDYEESVNLAEEIRTALEHRQTTFEKLQLTGCRLTGCEELWEDDAYIQKMTYYLKI